MINDYVKKILEARVYDVAIESPIHHARFLSKRLKNTVMIKREDLQPVFSFKLRGAYNKVARLTDEQKRNGVIAASAGNHAQGLALAASKQSIEAIIVMPTTTPRIKVANVQSFGAKTVLHGDTFDEAYTYARHLGKDEGYTFIPPYDDPDVIAGQGTIGVEILRQHPDPIDAIFLPVGGGGLIAGIAAYIKFLRPEIKVIGVEAEDSACLKAALDAGNRVILDEVGIFADGVAVAQIGEAPFEIAQHCVDDVITVNTDQMCAAIKDIFEDTRALSEPAGALALAGLKKYVAETGVEDQTLMTINSGANVNFDRLRHITERSEIGENREVILAVTIDEKPGSFKRFCEALSGCAISEFNYRYADANKAQIFVGIKIDMDKHPTLHETLKQQGYTFVDMTQNEMAKLHTRHMVGGHGQHLQDERVYRFEFPERPGALLKFLTHLGDRWNISLFHYRNHGAAYGRVLVGIQVPKQDENELHNYLQQINYRYWDESDNDAYRLFLI